MARLAWKSLAIGAGLAALTGAASCSLLAPSDEEAMAGLTKSDAATNILTETGAPETSTATDGGTDGQTQKETGSTVCPGCQVACNQGQCSSCYLNGAPCKTNGECCGGACSAQGTCGPAAGACTASNESCAATPGSCCAGTTCSAERGLRCDVCKPGGENCKADNDCCGINCDNGSCKACIPTGTAGCARAQQCCSGVCNGGTCG